ncbi:MAG TPA: hypothetical protein VEQ63_03435 [Bryobacteraceae bacterium]|nr:hypothetical protein [Bryobacteraceae bacterium]
MDLRVPSGWFFLLSGGIVLLVGVLSPELRAPLSEVNINLYAGLAMAAFGGSLLWLAKSTR